MHTRLDEDDEASTARLTQHATLVAAPRKSPFARIWAGMQSILGSTRAINGCGGAYYVDDNQPVRRQDSRRAE